jgi:hypothetical protein
MKTHELKTVQPYFDAVFYGEKTFELRRDDRGFAVGDVLVLREWDAAAGAYGPRTFRRRVTYVLRDYPGVTPGYAVLGLAPEDR